MFLSTQTKPEPSWYTCPSSLTTVLVVFLGTTTTPKKNRFGFFPGSWNLHRCSSGFPFSLLR